MPNSFSLSATYRRLARPWPLDELTVAYRAALARGSRYADERPVTHPIEPLSSTVPRLVRLASATHILHLVPDRAGQPTGDAPDVITPVVHTLDETAAGSLHLCHLALEVADRSDSADEWVSYTIGQTSEALPALSVTASPPSLIAHGEEAARWVAVSIDHAYAEPPAAPRAIADALSHLLVMCVFADEVADRP